MVYLTNNDLTWLDPNVSGIRYPRFLFIFQQQRQQHKFNAVYCIVIVDSLGLGSNMFYYRLIMIHNEKENMLEPSPNESTMTIQHTALNLCCCRCCWKIYKNLGYFRVKPGQIIICQINHLVGYICIYQYISVLKASRSWSKNRSS